MVTYVAMRSSNSRFSSLCRVSSRLFQAKIVSLAAQSSAKVLVGDIIGNVHGVTVASDDGMLINGEMIGSVVTKISQSPKGEILKLDVLRQYISGRSISTRSASVATAPDHGNGSDKIDTHGHKSARPLSSNAEAGLKITGLNDSGDENADNY
jgi:hypothetical protein